jgi:branched-chain amino acid transport system substrate-binding protein
MRFTFIILVAIAILLTGCTQEFSVESSETLKIGVILPQTGPIASVASGVLQGIELAVSEYNVVHDTQIRLILEDSGCSPQGAVTAFTKLVTVDQVSAVIGPFCSGAVLASAPVANEKEIVLISPGGVSPDITNAGDYVFRVTPSDALEAVFFSTYLKNSSKKLAILYEQTEWATTMQKTFVEAFPNQIVAIETFEFDTIDVKSELAKIQKKDPDSLLVLAYPNHYETITSNFIEIGLDVPLYATHTFETPAVKALGKMNELYIYATFGYPGGSEITNTFHETYESMYDEVPGPWVGFGYDATKIISRALNVCGEDSNCIKDALYSTQNYEGVTGMKSFDENGDVTDATYVIKHIRNNSFVEIQ